MSCCWFTHTRRDFWSIIRRPGLPPSTSGMVASEVRKRNCCASATERRSPSCSTTGVVKVIPLWCVPFLLPKSSRITPSGVGVMRAWKREICRSATTISQVDSRPSTRVWLICQRWPLSGPSCATSNG